MADSNTHELPSEYEFLKVLGAGGFGKVLKCWKKDTKQTVAVKIPTFPQEDSTEVSMMEKLMDLKLDQHNIIKFFGWFDTRCGKAMVFESLDMSVEDYILKRDCAPMRLTDVRTIIQQLATAFSALKSFGLIHTDLKPDNIMIVDHQSRPFRVKLIDFGLAIHRSKVQQGMTMQVVSFRAPEIMLGLPFTEAIDMWALGCVMSAMLHGFLLFPGKTEYEAMHDIIALLGVPADHLLDNGLKTGRYFTKTESNSWRLKTHQEFWRKQLHKAVYKTNVRYSLDDLRKLRLEKINRAEAVERAQSIDLLEAMLNLDEAERITPSQILTHPFIVKGQNSSDIKEQLPAGVIMVRPAAAMDRVLLDIDVDFSEEPPATAALEKDDNIHPDHHSPVPSTPPGVILVQPAAVENTLQLEDEERPASLQEELKKTSSVKVTDGETTARTHDGAGTQKKETKEKKKRRNCVRRLFSWMKKTFGSCCAAVDEDQTGDE